MPWWARVKPGSLKSAGVRGNLCWNPCCETGRLKLQYFQTSSLRWRQRRRGRPCRESAKVREADERLAAERTSHEVCRLELGSLVRPAAFCPTWVAAWGAHRRLTWSGEFSNFNHLSTQMQRKRITLATLFATNKNNSRLVPSFYTPKTEAPTWGVAAGAKVFYFLICFIFCCFIWYVHIC